MWSFHFRERGGGAKHPARQVTTDEETVRIRKVRRDDRSSRRSRSAEAPCLLFAICDDTPLVRSSASISSGQLDRGLVVHVYVKTE